MLEKEKKLFSSSTEAELHSKTLIFSGGKYDFEREGLNCLLLSFLSVAKLKNFLISQTDIDFMNFLTLVVLSCYKKQLALDWIQ